MKKDDFTSAVRVELQLVPLETRKTWRDADLLIWWNKARAENSYLILDGCREDLWQRIPGICRDLIGINASR